MGTTYKLALASTLFVVALGKTASPVTALATDAADGPMTADSPVPNKCPVGTWDGFCQA